MNGWFGKLRNDAVVASGNAGIWLTYPDGRQQQISPTGIGPVWAGHVLVYSNNDNATATAWTPWAQVPFSAAFNAYVGSDCTEFAAENPDVVRFRFATTLQGLAVERLEPITGACNPRFYGRSFGYLYPRQLFPDNTRALIIDGVERGPRRITIDWVPDKAGSGYVTVVGDGTTYGKLIFDQLDRNITMRAQHDETPLVCFMGPDGSPWLVTGLLEYRVVRNAYSAAGWLITGDFRDPDARMIDTRCCVVGSTGSGTQRIEWLDLNPAERVDIRDL